jgi:CRISPR-associated protein Cas1
MRVEASDAAPIRVALDDIAVLICNAHGLTYSNSLLVKLAERGALVLLCGANHNPVAWLWPLNGHFEQAGRMIAQAGGKESLKRRVWQRLVRGKLVNQGAVVAALGHKAGAFEALARKVAPGDRGNLEAQAAQRYWPLLFGPGWRRNRDAEGANALLNWGYTILRSAVARAVMAAGLHPSLGVFHRNTQNAMCLVDDVMEPFRPFVDLAALRLVLAGHETLDPHTKRRLVAVMYLDLVIEGETSPLLVCLERLALSLARSFQAGKPELALPTPPTALELAPLGHETC